MDSSSPNGPLEVTLRTHNFPQSGSWSMIDLAKLPVQHAVAMLSRYAAGRVNPYTVLVGEAVGMTFRMGRQGRLNIENALSKLPQVSTLGNTLEIGFGVEDVTRLMAKSDGGAMLLGLCAALKECFSDGIAIEVLLEYARSTKADSQWMPSNLEWRNLLDACAGALAASNFATRAEVFMGLANDEPRLSAYRSYVSSPIVTRGCSAPKSIADALVALSKLSLDQMDSVTIRGEPDAGWLGAVAEWFLDLRITIIDESSGATLYMNHTESVETQVRIVYASRTAGDHPTVDQIALLPPSSPSGELPPKKKRRKYELQPVQIKDRTYHLDLEEVTDQILLGNPEYNAHVVSGRVEWKKVLRSTFMSDFTNLMSVSQTVGSAIGSAARIFRAVAMADQKIPSIYLGACTSYCNAASGNGFVANVINWFPELGELQKSSERAAGASFEEAKKEYEKCISSLRRHCNCKTCQHDRNGFKYNAVDLNEGSDISGSASMDDQVSDRSDQEGFEDWDPDQYCLVLMSETIIVLCRSLSNLTLLCEGLLPMRSGMELAYGRQLNLRRFAHLGRRALNALQDLRPIAFCMDFDNNFSMGMQERNEEGAELRLHSILELFAGRKVSTTNIGLSAVCVNGLSAFLGVLKDTSCETRDDVARIYIVPGRIQFDGKSYSRLTDRKARHLHVQEMMPLERLLRSKDVLKADGEYARCRLSVREGSIDLQCMLEFMSDRQRPTIPVGPSAFAVFLGSRRGLVSCRYRSKRRCNRFLEAQNLETKALGENATEISMDGRTCLFLRPATGTQALAVMASTIFVEVAYLTYIVDEECQDCCLRAANAVNLEHWDMFCFIYIP